MVEIPQFDTMHIDEIGFLHDDVDGWQLKALCDRRYLPLNRFEEEALADNIPDYWCRFGTTLNELQEELVVRQAAELA